MFLDQRTTVKTETKEDGLIIKIESSLDDNCFYLSFTTSDGKFKAERKFPNSFSGKERLEKGVSEFSNQEELKKYLGIK